MKYLIWLRKTKPAWPQDGGALSISFPTYCSWKLWTKHEKETCHELSELWAEADVVVGPGFPVFCSSFFGHVQSCILRSARWPWSRWLKLDRNLIFLARNTRKSCVSKIMKENPIFPSFLLWFWFPKGGLQFRAEHKARQLKINEKSYLWGMVTEKSGPMGQHVGVASVKRARQGLCNFNYGSKSQNLPRLYMGWKESK